MKQYTFTNEADGDLDAIWDYVAADNPRAAMNLEDKIIAACRLLADNPHIGHKREYVARDDVRFWNVGNYCIVYLAATSPISIIRILNGYRDIGGILQ